MYGGPFIILCVHVLLLLNHEKCDGQNMQHTFFWKIIQISKPTCSHRDTSQWGKERLTSDGTELAPHTSLWHASYITETNPLDP